MTRFFSVIIILSTLVLSCTNNKSKKDEGSAIQDETVVREVKEDKNKDIVYLDTAENIYSVLCQDWVIADDAEALEGMAENSTLDIAYRSLCFSTKGTFLKNPRNAFDYGNWIYDNAAKTITLSNTVDKSKDVYKIAKVVYDELILVNVGIHSKTNLKFIAPGKRYENANDEPYYLENNRWRIKPRSKESDAEIHQRLKENIYFFILFYKSALAKGDRAVSFWGLPSCFKWYGGGIYLKKKDELKDNWISCFYDEEQAMQAYALADKLLSQKFNWPKGEKNWLKLNLAVVEMMYKKMDEIK